MQRSANVTFKLYMDTWLKILTLFAAVSDVVWIGMFDWKIFTQSTMRPILLTLARRDRTDSRQE